jgi:iron(III) transport system substrate-binding protein
VKRKRGLWVMRHFISEYFARFLLTGQIGRRIEKGNEDLMMIRHCIATLRFIPNHSRAVQKEPSSALSGTFSHPKWDGRRPMHLPSPVCRSTCEGGWEKVAKGRMRALWLGAITLLCALPLACSASAGEVVNVYSYRQPELVQPLFDAFTKETGIEVRMIYADKGLIERLEQEGPLSPADLLLTSDVGRLVDATNHGLAQAVDDAAIAANIPANLRDADHRWFGLTMRARVIYASRDRVAQGAISYEELADPKWKGKICTRPGDHPYNLGLIAAMIAKRGEAETKTWLTGLKANLAVKPSGNDRSQAKSVYAGECDLALGNTYYMGLMATDEKEPVQKEWAKALKILFPTSSAMGTHVNISGMLLTKSAPDKTNAIRLMQFLAQPEAQKIYADGNFEYPVNPAVKASELVQSWGNFVPDTLNLVEIAKNQAAASRLVDDVGFNN